MVQNTVVCGGCGQAALMPAQPLLVDTPWVCARCALSTPEAAVRQTVTALKSKLKQLTLSDRYSWC